MIASASGKSTNQRAKFTRVWLVPVLAFAFGSIVASSSTSAPPHVGRSARETLGEDENARRLVDALAQQKIHLDLEQRLCSIEVSIDIRDDLLEYILVNPQGAAHESLFTTSILGSQLNVALLALGVVPGKNATWIARDPPPSQEEMRAGVAPYTVEPPKGDGFFLYAAWREADETFFVRVEDLMRNLESGRSMLRHRWVYLGSRMARIQADKPEVFVADLEGNLVNLALFEQGNTLLTGALPECLNQTIWLPNAWLLPQRGETVELVFARDRLATLPPDLEARLPQVDREAKAADGR